MRSPFSRFCPEVSNIPGELRQGVLSMLRRFDGPDGRVPLVESLRMQPVYRGTSTAVRGTEPNCTIRGLPAPICAILPQPTKGPAYDHAPSLGIVPRPRFVYCPLPRQQNNQADLSGSRRDRPSDGGVGGRYRMGEHTMSPSTPPPRTVVPRRNPRPPHSRRRISSSTPSTWATTSTCSGASTPAPSI